MKVIDLKEKLGLTLFTQSGDLNKEITSGYVSDLLSDVMGHANEGAVWLTLQNHLNVVAIASLKDLACVVLVKGIEPTPDVVAKANSEDVVILGSTDKTFELAGKVYQLLQ
jgi:serine kinase of HPr protein (carbohydrate metabolism regulator)